MVLTKNEQQLKSLLTVWAVLFLAAGIWITFFSTPTERRIETLFRITGTILVVLSLLSAVARTGVRHHLVLLDVLKFAAFCYGIVLMVVGWNGDQPELMFGIASLVVCAVTIVFHSRALRARFNLHFLSGRQALAFQALAGVTIVGRDYQILSPDELTERIDSYLSSFASSRKFSLRIALLALEYIPLGFLRPPLSWMGAEDRILFIKKRFLNSKGALRDLIRGIKQMVYLVYYGDQKTNASIGYVPFEDRERFLAMKPKEDPPHLKVVNSTTDITTDICIIGSGAAGAVLAYNLAKRTNRKVTILERGSYVVPQRDFTNRETDMLPMLYADGGLQLTQDFDLAILQGTCVGGTTVVNNGICFRVPDDVLSEWDGIGASVDRKLLADSFSDVEKIIRVKELDHDLAGKGSNKFVEGCERLNLEVQWVHTNFEECVGSGYCNLGCKYNRKLSMLLNYLPMAVELGVGIVPDCTVEKIETSGSKATKIICSGKHKNKYTVTANTVVVAAGAIASSGLLMKSGIRKNVGTRVSFNIATPMHAEFAEKLNTFDGVQMCCYLKEQDCLLETTFNPPAASALIMPGWFEEHTTRMQRYPFLATAAPVVGSKPNGKIRRSIFGSVDVDYTMDSDDLMRLKKGMKLLSKVFLASGATCVMPSMFETIEIRSESDLQKIDDHIQKPEDVALSSAHPQGGNPMSNDPGIGVVDTNFKVHGFDNLYVCDASIFPTSVRVNPQLTIMAMATYAAQRIA